ncbi:pyridoxamine 5'-phosphate oxidase family protein [Caloramator proteoclasticus]|uniref:Pyridoxamine 5'-phosphate oxidase n=1 Tax=Caloramator proteoclasticus DSM 10124 TaxID=1121262 RepID=A0A1M4TV52_9CLOT|nr:pyridoxamine 5'-phosphate oxidase family protein [Caloramator proteoclasticus]SHE48295.1 Pyridoxamine 5'-phosphate oxidase [Caloramator proteoclasticus DSM 10124]
MKGCLVAYFNEKSREMAEVISKVLGPSMCINLKEGQGIDFDLINFFVFILDSDEEYALKFFIENLNDISQKHKVFLIIGENELASPIKQLFKDIDKEILLEGQNIEIICKLSKELKVLRDKLVIKEMPTEKLKFFVEEYINSNTTCILTTCGIGVRATPIEYTYKDGYLYFLTEGGEKFSNLYLNNRVSIAIYDKYQGMNKLFGMQIEGEAYFVEFASNEYKKIVDLKGYKFENIVNLPFKLNMIKVKINKVEFLNSKFKQMGYDAKQIFYF